MGHQSANSSIICWFSLFVWSYKFWTAMHLLGKHDCDTSWSPGVHRHFNLSLVNKDFTFLTIFLNTCLNCNFVTKLTCIALLVSLILSFDSHLVTWSIIQSVMRWSVSQSISISGFGLGWLRFDVLVLRHHIFQRRITLFVICHRVFLISTWFQKPAMPKAKCSILRWRETTTATWRKLRAVINKVG